MMARPFRGGLVSLSMLFTILLHMAEEGVRAGARAVRDWADRTERELVEALTHGDQGAFSWVVHKYWKSMHRVASGMLRSENVAAEVVQETWEAVFKEIGGFRGEASLRNWIFRILVNRARRVGKKEARSIPFSDLVRRDAEDDRRDPIDEFTGLGRWKSPVHGWRLIDPQNEAMNRQGVEILNRELENLPETQRVVVTMRDVEGLESKEVCSMLEISEANQRVLLHRGRTALRRALEAAEAEIDEGGGGAER
jgi:RNA polymerase sigma-70 factor (ECF subfamily)